MTVEEAIKELDLFRSEKKRYLKHGQSVDVLDIAISALEEVQKYRAIGTVSEFRENKNFLEFLYNTIQPNEMEQYLAMYQASREKGE